MKTRDKSITVTEMDTLRHTERECNNCEDGTFVQDGHELICTQCQYSPSRNVRLRRKTEWEKHTRQVQSRANGERDGRPRLVGGYEDAYWGSGSYCFDPAEGFSL